MIVTAMPAAPTSGNNTPQPAVEKLGRRIRNTPAKASKVAIQVDSRARSPSRTTARTAVIIGWVNAIVVASASGMSHTARNIPKADTLIATPRTHCNGSRGNRSAWTPSCRASSSARIAVPVI